ncbi:hypothetical protein [Glaciecola sp. 1036]|uniref:hypothetical protein n=1 Tax=Alteromonadaceae TaxID=72275 RepID=UPI003CFF7DF1
MWRKIIIVVQVLLIIWVLQTNWARDAIMSIGQTFSSWTGTVINLPDRQKIMTLRDDFMRNNMSLKPHQTDYVIEVTENVDSINIFHQRYCISEDKNPYLFGENLTRFCGLIEQSGILPKPL